MYFLPSKALQYDCNSSIFQSASVASLNPFMPREMFLVLFLLLATSLYIHNHIIHGTPRYFSGRTPVKDPFSKSGSSN